MSRASPFCAARGAVVIAALGLLACQEQARDAARPLLHPEASLTHPDDAGAGAESLDALPSQAQSAPEAGPGIGTPLDELPCNGQVAYCSLSYGTPLQLMSHASAATRVASWQVTAQDLSLSEQMRSDVPALDLEIYNSDGELQVCVGRCQDGHIPLAVVLNEVKQFLEAYTRNTLTLFLDLHTEVVAVVEAFADAELGAYHFVPAHPREFPTLGTMIEDGARLVVFAQTTNDFIQSTPSSLNDAATALALEDDAAGARDAAPPNAAVPNAGARDAATAAWPAWLLPTQHWVQQTEPQPRTPGDINCSAVSGADDSPILILHMHAPNPDTGLPSEAQAEKLNGPTMLLDRLDQCEILHGRAPSFVAFDFVELGNPQTSLLRLNLGQPVVQLLPAERDN